MNENKKAQFVGTAERLKNNRITETHPENKNEQIENQNTRTLMQALLGCRKNSRECKEEETEWEPKIEPKEVNHA